MLVNIPYICMLQGLFTSSTCCWFPFFWGEGGHLALDGRAPFCRFFLGGGGVQSKQSCMMPYTQTNCAMKHGPHFSSAWRLGSQGDLSHVFLKFQNVEAHLNVLRGQFSGPLPRIWDPGPITGMVGLFSPLIWGRIRIPSSTRVWFFQGGTQVSKDMFSSYISQVTLNWYGNTCQKKSHLTSAFCVCFTPFVQGLAVSCRCICTLQI